MTLPFTTSALAEMEMRRMSIADRYLIYIALYLVVILMTHLGLRFTTLAYLM